MSLFKRGDWTNIALKHKGGWKKILKGRLLQKGVPLLKGGRDLESCGKFFMTTFKVRNIGIMDISRYSIFFQPCSGIF